MVVNPGTTKHSNHKDRGMQFIDGCNIERYVFTRILSAESSGVSPNILNQLISIAWFLRDGIVDMINTVY